MMNKPENIMELWPFDYPPRKNQEIALPWLAENEDKKYLILEAPVGAGKSNIGLTYGLYRGGQSFVLTPQRILQLQYEESFYDVDRIDLSSFYGKSNYTCKSRNTNCAIGSLVKPVCEHCPYEQSRNRAVAATNTVMNYRLGLGVWAYTNLFRNSDRSIKKRRLMILDECHTLEEQLVGFDILEIAEWRCKHYKVKFQQATNLEDAVAYVQEVYVPGISKTFFDMKENLEYLESMDVSQMSKTEFSQMRELAELEKHLSEAREYTMDRLEEMEEEYVLVYDKVRFEFRRLKGAHAFNTIVKPMAEQFLFMSSTVLNKDGFCRDLGINPDEAAFLSLPSEFPIENRPVYYMPQTKMNWKWAENEAGKDAMSESIKTLLTMHGEESGLIHTGNFKIAEWLVSELEGRVNQEIYHHNPDSGLNRNDVITAFIDSSRPSVLISPSSTEGLDLKDDLARFAIFAKVPFGSLGDQWIKRRMDMSNEWYRRCAIIDIIQGGGRIVRGPEDVGSVYILDESFGYLHQQTHQLLPEWWKDSYKKI